MYLFYHTTDLKSIKIIQIKLLEMFRIKHSNRRGQPQDAAVQKLLYFMKYKHQSRQ